MTDKFGLPADAVAVNINVGVVANTAMNAVMPAVSGYINVLRGFKITGTGATAASAIDVTTTGCGAAGPNLRWLYPLALILMHPTQRGVLTGLLAFLPQQQTPPLLLAYRPLVQVTLALLLVCMATAFVRNA